MDPNAKKNNIQILRGFSIELAFLFLFVFIFAITYINKYQSYLLLSFAAIIGLLCFIFLKKNAHTTTLDLKNYIQKNDSLSIVLSCSIVFFVFYGLSLLTLLDGYYTKTIWYYIFISICASTIAIELFNTGEKLFLRISLVKSVLLYLNISLSNQLIYPFGIGNPDNFYHINNLIIPILDQGRIPVGFTYSSFPIHHILSASLSLIANNNPTIVYHWLGAILMSFGVILAFLIGKKIFNVKVGLLSALLYCCSDYLIYWGAHPVQLSYMYPMILLLFTLSIYIMNNRNASLSILYLIVSLNIILLHHYSALIMSTILLLILIIEYIEKIRVKKYKIKSARLAHIFVLMLLSQWMFYSNTFNSFVNIALIYTDAFKNDIGQSITAQIYYDQLSFTFLALNEIGSSILIVFSVIGYLYLLNNRSLYGNVLLGLATIFVLLIGIGIFINVMYLLPNRLYAFMQQLSLIYLSSLAIIWIVNNIKNGKYKNAFMITSIFCLLFFSASSTIAGFETSPFLGEQSYWKFYETNHERKTSEWATNYIVNASNFYTNPGFVSPLGLYPKYSVKETNDELIVDLDNITSNSYFSYSIFDEKMGFKYKRIMETARMGSNSLTKMDIESRQVLNDDKNLLCIYENGMLSIFRKQDFLAI